MDKIEDFYQSLFPQPVTRVELLHQTADYFVHLLVLDSGERFVAKQVGSKSWIGLRSSQDHEFAQIVAESVASRLHLTKAARRFGTQYGIAWQDKLLFIIPFCQGEILSNWTKQQSNLLGSHLASIHRLRLSNEGGNPFPHIESAHFPQSTKSLIRECNDNLSYRAHEWVVSHRDIHHHNVVWIDEECPNLIDWDSAGLIHPFVELIGLATNCCNLDKGEFLASHFSAAIEGYKAENGDLPAADAKLWGLCFHSWLLWLGFCIYQDRDEDVKQTLVSIDLLKETMPEMKSIYNSLATTH